MISVLGGRAYAFVNGLAGLLGDSTEGVRGNICRNFLSQTGHMTGCSLLLAD